MKGAVEKKRKQKREEHDLSISERRWINLISKINKKKVEKDKEEAVTQKPE